MTRRKYGCLLLSIGILLACLASAALFYEAQCPNIAKIETVIPDDALVEVNLKRTICFGTCPSYTLHIAHSGEVTYQGHAYTRQSGEHHAQMSPEAFQQLVQTFEDANFYALVAQYHRESNLLCSPTALDYWTDAPTVMLGISVNGRYTEIEHYKGFPHAPPALTELENRVDDLVNSDQWVE